MNSDRVQSTLATRILWVVWFLLFLYLFLLSIQLMGNAFKFFGEGFAETLITTTADPFTGLFIGILATSITQSSSTTSSIVVGLVAGGALQMHNAIPLIMGVNIGTTVTNTIVSLGNIGRRDDFRRAFAASVVHDVFNILTVLILFPLQYYTRFLERISIFFEQLLVGYGGAKFSSPLKVITQPVAEYLSGVLGEVGPLILTVALILLFVSLRYMVKYMKALVMERAEVVFEQTIFKTAYHGLFFGLLLTTLVQSSSVTTSLIVPLAGAGMISIQRVFPYTLGANIGTTVTAIMASLATGDPSALAVALSHLMFNICGILMFWWIQFVPIGIANVLAGFTVRNRSFAVFYILVIFSSCHFR